MVQKLVNVLQVSSLAAGASVVVAHELNSAGQSVAPTQVFPNGPTPIVATSATATDITFTNSGDSTESAVFRAEHDYSTVAASPPQMLWQGDGAPVTSPLTLYVATTGSDTNDGSQASPFLTIQAAIEEAKKRRLRALVTVRVGAGTFDGFAITGFDIESPSALTSTAAAGLSVEGTFTQITPSTGTASGTVTSSATGSVLAGFVTITDIAQNWTVNELVGKFLFLQGASSYSYLVIHSNTATTITIASSTASAAGRVYSIVEPATIINRTVSQVTQLSTAVDSTGQVWTSFVPTSKVGILINENNTRSVQIRVIGFKFNDTSSISYAVFVKNEGASAVQLIALSVTNSTASVSGFNIAGSVRLNNVYVNHTASGGFCMLGVGPGVVSLTGVVLKGNGSVNSNSGVSFGQGLLLSSSNCIYDTFSLCISPSTGARGCTLSGANAFVGSTTGISLSSAASASISGTCSFTACTTALEAVSLGLVAISSTAFTGSGNTNGFSASTGGRIQVPATATIGATNEIVLDGVAATLAAMRAASPRLVTNTYGSIVHE
jgi:hypothetical protein